MTQTQTHSLEEVAEAITGSREPQRVRWIADQLRAGRFSGIKVNRGEWRMTDEDVEAAIAACRKPARTQSPVSGMTSTSRRRIAS